MGNTLGHPHVDCKSVGLRLQWFESTTCHLPPATAAQTVFLRQPPSAPIATLSRIVTSRG
jgi:hypothetical protein